MSLQEIFQNVAHLGEKLVDPDPKVCQDAITELSQFVKGDFKPDIMPVFRINTFPCLAEGIRKQVDRQALIQLLMFACDLAQRMQCRDSVMLEAVLERMKEPWLSDHADKSTIIVDFWIIALICEMGVPARLCGIKAAYDIKDAMRAVNTIGALTKFSSKSDPEPIYEPVLTLLSESSREEAWWCLCELAYAFFKPKVSRDALKQALVKIWKKAKDQQKQDVEYKLKRCGFKRVLAWWI